MLGAGSADALITQFGDGIMSAIDFSAHVEKVSFFIIKKRRT